MPRAHCSLTRFSLVMENGFHVAERKRGLPWYGTVQYGTIWNPAIFLATSSFLGDLADVFQSAAGEAIWAMMV